MTPKATPKSSRKQYKMPPENLWKHTQKKLEKKHQKSWKKTCVGIGTGSALNGGGLQRDGLKAVLATAVVFGRACGAASTTLANEKTIGKTLKKCDKLERKHTKHTKLGLEPPPCGPVSQKSTREIPKTAQTSQGHIKTPRNTSKMTPK